PPRLYHGDLTPVSPDTYRNRGRKPESLQAALTIVLAAAAKPPIAGGARRVWSRQDPYPHQPVIEWFQPYPVALPPVAFFAAGFLVVAFPVLLAVAFLVAFLGDFAALAEISSKACSLLISSGER